MDDLLDTTDPPAKDLYCIIWMEHYPKKIKIFLWELSLGAINTADSLQHRMLYMSISPSWCVLCQSHFESLLVYLCIVLLPLIFVILFWMPLIGH